MRESRAGTDPVLFVAYYFPPSGGGGVQRSSKFVRYLSEYGFAPVVITGAASAGPRGVPSDDTLTRDIPTDATIVRVPGTAPLDGQGPAWRAARFFRRPSPFDRWWIEAAVEAGRRQPDIALIYASMSPFSSAVIAGSLAQQLRRPWVADLRDPWALSEFEAYPTLVHRALELRRMRSLLASADAVVVTGPEVQRRLSRALPELANKLVVVIPNGYDAVDFTREAPEAREGPFRLVHAGVFYSVSRGRGLSRQVRGALGGVGVTADFGTRSPRYLLAALRRLLDKRPELRNRIELHLAGALSSEDRRIIDASGCAELVRTPGYVSHTEATRLLQSADALFLPMEDMPRGVRSASIPGKLYEYLASGRPILGAVPDGDTRDLLLQDKWALVTRPRDVDALEAGLHELLAHAPGRRGRVAPRPGLQRFERRSLTGDLAAVFDQVLARYAATRQAPEAAASATVEESPAVPLP